MANESRPCPCDIGDRFDYGGRGQEVQVGHIKAYICKPSANTDKAVIVIHDIFGWQLPNTRYIADMLTTNGYIAICPDFFVGQEAWKPSNDWASFNDWVKTRDAGKIDKEVDVVLKYLKDQCGAEKIGVIGFCWGGAALQHLMLKNPHLKTGVSLYGVISHFEDKHSLLHPTFFIFGEKDNIIPLEQEKTKNGCIRKGHCQQVTGGYLAPLLSSGEATSGMLHPILDSCVQERHEAPEAGPAEGNKDDEGTGTSLLQGEAGTTGPVQPQEVMTERGPHLCL